MTLGQLGAEVVRVDPIGGAADYHRWPVTDDGTSIYWAGLNKGKRSVAADLRSPEGQDLVQRLIADSGVLITNVAGREWHSYDNLTRLRPDLIHVEVSGRADGGTGVDYTVNAGLGFPMVTGPAELATPVNHVLPAWDVACGIYAALAVVTALRHRDATGQGQRISIPLENVALATAGNLSFLTEVMVNGTARERIGNSIYGQYGQDFTSSDGVSFMIVALTRRHFRDLTELTGTTKAVAALAQTLGADFNDEGERYRHRDALTGLFTEWFSAHTAAEITDRAVGDVRAVGAVPQLRRGGQRGPSYGQPDVRTARPAADRRVPGPRLAGVDQRGLPAGGGRTGTRRRHRRRAGGVAGTQPERDRPARRIKHGGNGFRRCGGSMSQLLKLLELQRGAGRRHVDRAGQRARRASARSAASSSRRAWPRRAEPSKGADCPPTCICSFCAAARPETRSNTRWRGCSTDGPRPRAASTPARTDG